jgi:hypothetical protein
MHQMLFKSEGKCGQQGQKKITSLSTEECNRSEFQATDILFDKLL